MVDVVSPMVTSVETLMPVALFMSRLTLPHSLLLVAMVRFTVDCALTGPMAAAAIASSATKVFNNLFIIISLFLVGYY